MRSNPSLESFPNVALETVAMLVWLTMALSRPRKEDRWALPLSTAPRRKWKAGIDWLIYWRLIAQSTAQGHLRAFYKFNYRTSWMQYKTYDVRSGMVLHLDHVAKLEFSVLIIEVDFAGLDFIIWLTVTWFCLFACLFLELLCFLTCRSGVNVYLIWACVYILPR